MNKVYEPLYQFDTTGKLRIWYMEQEGSKHRTIAGVDGGKLVTSGWTYCEATNVGRSNERDPIAQATFEIEAKYEHNLTRDYHRSAELAAGGAHFFEPMLAEPYEEFNKGFVQPKLDGMRSVKDKRGMWSREGKPIVAAPHIDEALEEIFEEIPNLRTDGELYNHLFRDDFDAIMSAVRKQKITEEHLELSRRVVQYHVYDLPSHKGPFSERTEILREIVTKVGHPSIIYVPTTLVTTREQFDDLHKQYRAQKYEGTIWRDPDSPYEIGKRSKFLQKRKDFFEEEFPISKILEGNGNWKGCAKMIEFIMPDDRRGKDGNRPKAGVRGTREFLSQLLIEQDRYGLVTVRYQNLTPAGVPRAGVVTAFHLGNRREF